MLVCRLAIFTRTGDVSGFAVTRLCSWPRILRWRPLASGSGAGLCWLMGCLSSSLVCSLIVIMGVVVRRFVCGGGMTRRSFKLKLFTNKINKHKG